MNKSKIKATKKTLTLVSQRFFTVAVIKKGY